MLKNPLGAGWGLQHTLQWAGSRLPTYLASYSKKKLIEILLTSIKWREDFTMGIELSTTPFENGTSLL